MLQLFNVNERQEGEICTRGRCTAMGYLFDKEKTLDTFDDEGWLHQVYLSIQYLYSIYTVSTAYLQYLRVRVTWAGWTGTGSTAWWGGSRRSSSRRAARTSRRSTSRRRSALSRGQGVVSVMLPS